jgi:hypothetical protein
VDARDKPGHDEKQIFNQALKPRQPTILRDIVMADGGNEARSTRGPKRNEWLLSIAAVFLDLPHRGMADAIDRKEHSIGPAHHAWQRGQVFFDATVMRK